MITAVDTSIILDILAAEPTHLEAALALYRRAQQEGKLVLCPIVWAELRPFFSSDVQIKTTLDKMNLIFTDFGETAASLAGEMWQHYRRNKGSRQRLIADFLIGAHAQVHAGRLLTRDRGFYRSYFQKLKILSPND